MERSREYDHSHSRHPASDETKAEAEERRRAILDRAKQAVPELMQTGRVLDYDAPSLEEQQEAKLPPERIPVAAGCHCFGCVCICDYRSRKGGWLEKTFTDLVAAVDARAACHFRGCKEALLDIHPTEDAHRLRVIPASWSMRHKLIAAMGDGVVEHQPQ